jgi:FKBP-type peptidyl-prolyl cis-trans isomerase
MNNYKYAFIGLLMLLAACNKNQKETPNGLKYTIIKAGDGAVPEKDQVLVFDYELRDSKDSVWGETFNEGIPAATKIADTSQVKNEDGMTQMFRMLSKGDSVKTEMSVKDFFTKVVGRPAPPYIDTTRSVTYTLKVQDIMSVDNYLKVREEQFKKRESRIHTRDAEDISKHLSENNITAEQDTSGLQYVIYNKSGKRKPTPDDCVEVKYTGRLLGTGEVFDAAQKVSFPLNAVIPGWRLGIPKLGIGDSATFFIPSKLAYGPQGYQGTIPKDAVLIFNVTLLDIKSEFDRTTGTCK